MQLAIETTGRVGSVAVVAGETVLRREVLDASKSTAATLTPRIQRLIHTEFGAEGKNMLHFLSVAAGPGSFTGLRIGVTTAKTLSYAWRIPLISVDSLEAIAAETFRVCDDCDSVTVALDAYRNEVFAGRFYRADLLPPLTRPSTARQKRSSEPSSLLMTMSQFEQFRSDSPAADQFSGDEKLFASTTSKSAIQRQCDAIGVGLVAIRAATLSNWSDPMKLVPRYMRQSAAEEKAKRSKAAP